MTLFIVSFAGFTGTLQAVSNVSSIFQQGLLYQKTPVEITYSVCIMVLRSLFDTNNAQVSAATAGLCAGPLFWSPLSRKIGRCGCILWATVLTMVCTIWAAVCTHPGDYESFVVSRLFGCLAGSCATTGAASSTVDILDRTKTDVRNIQWVLALSLMCFSCTSGANASPSTPL